MKRIVLSFVAGIGFLTAVSRGAEVKPKGFWDRDFPFLETTLDARKAAGFSLPNNLTVRGIVVSAGNDTFGCFDTDMLRWSVVWRGEGIKFASMAPISYAEPGKKNSLGQTALNKPAGEIVSAIGLYPGVGENVIEFKDPRPAGLDANELGRGAIAASVGRWEGVYIVENKAVLHYTVGGIGVHEYLSTDDGLADGSYARNIEIDPHGNELQLVVADYSPVSEHTDSGNSSSHVSISSSQTNGMRFDIRVVAGTGEAKLTTKERGIILLAVKPATAKQQIRVAVARGAGGKANARFKMPKYKDGGKQHWRESVVTQGSLATNDAAYVVDRLALPEKNPWGRKVRPSGLCFFPDGRAAVVTFDGDVWIVSGITADLKTLSWRRVASGLCEPQSIQFRDGLLYVFTRNGIVCLRDLNDDGEIDYYENFANCFAQSAETRNFPMDCVVASDGSFYLAEGGESKGIWGVDNGAVLKVAADGRSARRFADGFRQPYLGYNPKQDLLVASDQQGYWVPTSPVQWVREGSNYGFLPATEIKPAVRLTTEPVCWVPYNVAQSAAGLAWTLDGKLGPLNDHLMLLDYFRSGILLPFFDEAKHPVQGAVVRLDAPVDFPLLKAAMNPKDGLLYLAGFRIWGSNAKEWGGLGRLRHTGKSFLQPVQAKSCERGLLLQFADSLNPADSTNLANYTLQRWNYHRTANYGSGHYRMDDKPGQDYVPISGVLLSEDRRSLFVAVPGMKPAMQMELDCRIKSDAGQAFGNTVYFTVHELAQLDLKALGFPDADWTSLMAERKPSAQAERKVVISLEEGQRVYQGMGCSSCHSIDGTTAGRVGPTFAGLFGKERNFSNAKPVTADAGYIRESVLKPQAKIVREYAGLESGMPSYEGVLTDAQIESVILFIKSLKGVTH